MALEFPIDLSSYKKVSLDPSNPTLTDEQRDDLRFNIELCRDAIVFFTASGAARGVSGHTGGPYDTVPEVVILNALFHGNPDKYVPIHFDEAGHRVATQYLLSALEGSISPPDLLKYRDANSNLPGHPELGLTPGVKFSSGRLGHMWPFVNGVAFANRDKTVFCLGSDGSQQEGDDAEAARLAVAQNLNLKLLIDDNDVTIAGHPSEYLMGFDVARTLEGHGLKVLRVEGEDIDALYGAISEAVIHQGPVAVISKRRMMVGIEELEGSNHAHDVIPLKVAIKFLERRGRQDCVEVLNSIPKSTGSYTFLGSDKNKIESNRNIFGEAVVVVLNEMSPEERTEKVLCIDSDLEGSTGISAIRKAHPEIFVSSGIMERGNFSAAAGFGFQSGKQGIFATFSAFLEMCVSEITMARLNFSNVLCHFSHAGIDEMADNTCHFGLNNFFADNGLEDSYETRLYFPADGNQMRAVVSTVFFDKGLRFVFSTRSKVPAILSESGQALFSEEAGYKFVPGKDEVVRSGQAGYIVTYGDIVYRALDAVERLRSEGIDVGLINKPTLNVVDEETLELIGRSPFILVAESLNRKTGLGSKMGSWLLERGYSPRYAYIGTHREGCGGLTEQVPHQGIDPPGIIAKVRELIN